MQTHWGPGQAGRGQRSPWLNTDHELESPDSVLAIISKRDIYVHAIQVHFFNDVRSFSYPVYS